MASKDDGYYLTKIKNDIQFIIKQMNGVNIDELSSNEVLLDSMMFRLIQISENSKNLSNEYKMQNGNVPWNAVYGLRNRIVHDYGNVDLNIVYSTLTEDIPELFDLI